MTKFIATTIAAIITVLLLLAIILLPILLITALIKKHINKPTNKKNKIINFPIANDDKKQPQWERIFLPDGSEFYKLADSNEYPDTYLPYSKKHILTKTEYGFWKVLKEKCNVYGLIICPKVRMEDFIEIKVQDYKTKQSFRGRIKSRHVDFILCDNDLNILAGIELDDYSHNSKKAKETDDFKNQVFRIINLPLFRISVDKSNYGAQIEEVLKQLGF